MSVNPRPTGTIAVGGAVVVGCDRSWASQNAVAAATREAALRGTELVLLAVVERLQHWPDGLAWGPRVQAESAQEARAAVALALARVVATDPVVDGHAVVVKELDSPELSEIVARAGLLVLGRRGDGGQVAFSLGSTSWELARRFHCPILVVHDHLGPRERQHVGPDRAVIAGIDVLSAASVLSIASKEAVIRDLPLVVVHTLRHNKGVDRVLIAEEWLKFRGALTEAHIPAGAPIRLVIAEDDPARALLDRAGPEDLIVVGTRGQGRLAGLVPGSVSRQVLDETSCDVMVVQPGVVAVSPVPPDLVDLAVPSEAQRPPLVPT